jgi:hypothetical protein
MSKNSKRNQTREIQPAPAPGIWERRGTLLLVATALFLFVFFAYAGSAWAAALYRLLTDGPVLLLWLGAMVGLGTWISRFLASPHESLGFATKGALGIGCFSLLILLFGWGGALNRAVAWILIGLGITLALMESFGRVFSLSSGTPGEGRGGGSSELLNPHPNPPPEYRRRGPEMPFARYLNRRIEWTSWLWLIVVPFLAIAVLGALMPPGMLWRDEPNGYDVVEYHLQVPREWYEAGRIVALHHNVFSYFPFNVEMHYLLAMHLRGGPWAGMYLAQLMHVAMVVLAVVALAEFAGRKGIAAVLLAASTPWLTLLAPVAYNEGGLLLFGTLAIGWTWRAITEAQNRVRYMALAGVMAGFASGTKLTAVPMLLAAIPAAFGLAIFLRKEKEWLRPTLAFVAFGLLVLSPWLIRNFIWTRNPVFPEAMSVFGRGHFTAEQAERWRLAYVPPPAQRTLDGRVKASWEQIFADWRYGFVLIPAGLFAFIRGKRRSESLFLVALLAMWLVFWLFFTHLQSRFFVLAIPVAALLVLRIEAPLAKLALICCLLLQAGFGFLKVHDKASKELGPFLIALAIDHYPELDDRLTPVMNGTQHLCLIGSARAFVYEMPMSRLHYRTVFDVDVHGRDVVEAWADGCPHKAADVNYTDYDELQRLSWKEREGRGYWKIPAPPAGTRGREVDATQK